MFILLSIFFGKCTINRTDRTAETTVVAAAALAPRDLFPFDDSIGPV